MLPWLPLPRQVTLSSEVEDGNESTPVCSLYSYCNPAISEHLQDPEEICTSKVRSALSRVTHVAVPSPLYYKGCKPTYYLQILRK